MFISAQWHFKTHTAVSCGREHHLKNHSALFHVVRCKAARLLLRLLAVTLNKHLQVKTSEECHCKTCAFHVRWVNRWFYSEQLCSCPALMRQSALLFCNTLFLLAKRMANRCAPLYENLNHLPLWTWIPRLQISPINSTRYGLSEETSQMTSQSKCFPSIVKPLLSVLADSPSHYTSHVSQR